MDLSADIKNPRAENGQEATPHHAPLAKTTGEKWFDVVRFATGESFILALTAALAYVSSYGKDAYGPKGLQVPNLLKQANTWMNNKLVPLGDKGGDMGKRLAGAIAGTTILMHGGNAFIPVKEWLQNRKEKIVTYFNTRWGKPGEVEDGIERVRNQEKENWADVIKGRLGAWLVVFSSIMGADLVAGKSKSSGKYVLDEYNEKVGKMVAGFTKKGKDIIARIPEGKLVNEELEANKAFRFGKILALDVYATTAALFIWNAISKVSAMLRKEKTDEKEVLSHINSPPAHDAPESAPQRTSPSFREREKERPADFRALAQKEPAASGMAVQ